MGLRSQKEVRGMERGMERNLFESKLRGQRKEMTLFACLVITVRLNVTVSTNSGPCGNLDDWKHESCACIGDIHI